MSECLSDGQEKAPEGSDQLPTDQGSKYSDIFGAAREMVTKDPDGISVLYAKAGDFCPQIVQMESVDPLNAAKTLDQMKREAAEREIKRMDRRKLGLFW